MPIIQEVISTFDKLASLHKKKNDDYAVDSDPFSNFEFSEWFSSKFNNARDRVYAVIIGIKFARLYVLLNRKEAPNNEGIDDTFDDIIVYVALWKANWMRRNNKERVSDVRNEVANTI